MQDYKPAKNINEAIAQVSEEIAAVRKDPRRKGQADTVINGVGKQASIIKAACMYAYLHGEVPEIPFLDGALSGKPLKPGTKLIGS